MLLEISQKPTIRACSTTNFLINTSVFFETVYQDNFVLVTKFTYFMPNSKEEIWHCWNSEITDTVKELQNCHLLENSIVFMNLSLYRKASSILSCVSPWKLLKFFIMGNELCVPRTSILWNFVVCLGGLVSSRGMALCHWLRVHDILRQLCGLKTWAAITLQCSAISLQNKDHNCTAAKAWYPAYV